MMVVYIHGYSNIGDSLQMYELNFNLHSLHSTVVFQASLTSSLVPSWMDL